MKTMDFLPKKMHNCKTAYNFRVILKFSHRTQIKNPYLIEFS